METMGKRLAAVHAATAASSTTAPSWGRRRRDVDDVDLFTVLPTTSRQARHA